MKITDESIALTFDQMIEIAQKYNGTDPGALRRDAPVEYMIGVWLGWLFAKNLDLAPYVANIVCVTIDHLPGWTPGDIIPGEPDPLPGFKIEIVHLEKHYMIVTNAEGEIELPAPLAQVDTVGGRIAKALNKVSSLRRTIRH